jgi:hypothetical protein
MEPPSPARLYATLVGGVLVVLGIAGFFYDLSWLNFLYVGSGALGLVLAGRASRPYALATGLLYTALAIWDFSSAGWLHLALGLLGLAAVAGTGRLEPRAKAAAKSP